MFDFAQTQTNPLRQAITKAYRRDEAEAVADMLAQAQMSDAEKTAAEALARRLVTQVRSDRRGTAAPRPRSVSSYSTRAGTSA